MNLDELMNELADVREEYALSSRETERLKDRKTDLEHEIETKMAEAGIKAAGNKRLSISISEEVVPNVSDWESLFSFIKENDAFYLLQKRMAAGAYREAEQMGMEIPGVGPFTKTKMSVRAA